MIVFNALLYYLVIIPISLLPFPLLYALSDGLYILFYYLLEYRKKVVLQNIRNSFPDKTEKEHIEICKKFYRHFCDLVVESLKTFTISEKEVLKRVICTNPEVIDKYFDQKRSVIIAGGHYNNWELFAVAVDALIKHKTVGIYKPLSNKYFDGKMRGTRSKYGLEMISTKDVKPFFDKHINVLTATIFGTDQSPSNPNNAYWMKFLNQDTGVLFGAEKFAKDYNYPVVYGRLNKLKRGHYSLDITDVTDTPTETAYGEITEKITLLLEKDIEAIPQYWLWTHRRWKHKRPEGK
ncbi:MAG: lysophospholipid acyltransferase family protein [Bacteroidota bacterium]|nr:lysophospholipid acyltransferase family protein [Bacteroidota bacterium]